MFRSTIRPSTPRGKSNATHRLIRSRNGKRASVIFHMREKERERALKGTNGKIKQHLPLFPSLLSPVHICLRSANSVPAVEAINIGGAATWGNMLLIKQQLLWGGTQWTTRRYALRLSLMDWMDGRGHLYPRRGKYGVFSLTKIECWPQLFSHFCLKKSRSLSSSLPPFDSADSPLFLLPSLLSMNGKLKLNFSSFLVSPVAVGQPNEQAGKTYSR